MNRLEANPATTKKKLDRSKGRNEQAGSDDGLSKQKSGTKGAAVQDDVQPEIMDLTLHAPSRCRRCPWVEVGVVGDPPRDRYRPSPIRCRRRPSSLAAGKCNSLREKGARMTPSTTMTKSEQKKRSAMSCLNKPTTKSDHKLAHIWRSWCCDVHCQWFPQPTARSCFGPSRHLSSQSELAEPPGPLQAQEQQTTGRSKSNSKRGKRTYEHVGFAPANVPRPSRVRSASGITSTSSG